MAERRTEPYLSAYLHTLGGKLGLPIGGTFELTARCNFNCPMCYVHLNQKDMEAAGRELTAEQWIELARQAKEKGMVFALLTGGEPFVRKDFFEIYEAMKAMGIMVSINSNGSMLDGAIRERLMENPPFRVNISLYGGHPETYRTMCGQDAFDKVMGNIRAVKEAGVDVRINLSITPYNRMDLEKIYRIAQELNVHIKAASYMYPSIRTGSGYGIGNRLSPEEAAQCSVEWDLLRFPPEQFTQRACNMKALVNTEPRECGADPETGVSCRAGSSSFWMTWDGRMLPCGMMPGPTTYPLEVGFDTAWEQLKELTKQIRTPAKCVWCPKRDVCGVCAAACVTETGSFEGIPEYVCRQTEETIRLTWEAFEERKALGNEA